MWTSRGACTENKPWISQDDVHCCDIWRNVQATPRLESLLHYREHLYIWREQPSPYQTLSDTSSHHNTPPTLTEQSYSKTTKIKGSSKAFFLKPKIYSWMSVRASAGMRRKWHLKVRENVPLTFLPNSLSELHWFVWWRRGYFLGQLFPSGDLIMMSGSWMRDVTFQYLMLSVVIGFSLIMFWSSLTANQLNWWISQKKLAWKITPNPPFHCQYPFIKPKYQYYYSPL